MLFLAITRWMLRQVNGYTISQRQNALLPPGTIALKD